MSVAGLYSIHVYCPVATFDLPTQRATRLFKVVEGPLSEQECGGRLCVCVLHDYSLVCP